MKAMFDFYITRMKIVLATMFQYRISTIMWLLGMMVEPIVYLVVWTTVAKQQGGSVAGYTAATFAAYYIVWTLVRQMNIALTPYSFEHRIKNGRFSPELLRPMMPIHGELAWFTGMKFVYIAFWLPMAAILTLIFQPEFNATLLHWLAFSVLAFTGFLMRFLLLYVVGLITFWVTKVSAIFEIYFSAELLLSGRLVPMALMPDWANRISNFLPFRWTFGFLIEVALGRLSWREIGIGFLAQLGWILFGIVALRLIWRSAVRRYSAVGA